MAAEPDTTRAKIAAYLPAYQKERWQDHAAELGMSQSEFVRAMVQAGRRGFGAEENEASEADGADETDGPTGAHGAGDEGGSRERPVEPRSSDATPGVDDLEDRVLAVLDDGPCSWDELVSRMTDDIEARLDATLEALQAANRVRYSGRNGGYVRTEGD